MMSLPSHSDSPQLLGEEIGENIFKFQKIKSVLLSSNLVSLAGYPY